MSEIPTSEPTLTEVANGKMYFSDGTTLDLPKRTKVTRDQDARGRVGFEIDAKRCGTIFQGRKKSDCASFLTYVSGK